MPCPSTIEIALSSSSNAILSSPIFLNAIEHSLVSATVTHGSSATHLIPRPLIQKEVLIISTREVILSFELMPPKIG